jgi:hypothetical protein
MLLNYVSRSVIRDPRRTHRHQTEPQWIRLGNPNGAIDRTDRYVGALNVESIAKNDGLNDQVASRAIKWKAAQWIRQVAFVDVGRHE